MLGSIKTRRKKIQKKQKVTKQAEGKKGKKVTI